MIAKLICFFKGHKRGKRVSIIGIRCPRCGAEWVREQKVKA